MSGSSPGGSANTLSDDSASDPGICNAAGVTIAMWDRALCYVHSSGKLYCAGRIGERVFGPAFGDAEIPGPGVPVQLLGSATWNHINGNGLCARLDSGMAWCLGYGGRDKTQTQGLYWGQFFTSDSLEPGSIWKQWGTRGDIQQLTTTGLSGICARYADGASECVGQTCGFSGNPQSCYATPAMGVTYASQAAIPHLSTTGTNSLWIDGGGQLHRNDTTTFRAANGADCIVAPEGAACAVEFHGLLPTINRGLAWYTILSPTKDAGKVVDAVRTSGGEPGESCWLTDEGNVYCRDSAGVQSRFASGKVLAIAGTMYGGRDICAVYSDGSIWCRGANSQGQLGTGNTQPLNTETEVQPAGSARISCDVK